MDFGKLNIPNVEDRKFLGSYERYLTSAQRSKREEARMMDYVLTRNLDRKDVSPDGERDRTKTWSMSSNGGCMRAQQFTFLGYPQQRPTPTRQNIFENGDYLHLRYQVVGLVTGTLSDVEVGYTYKDFARGTADGLTCWDEVMEIKSINTRGFSGVKEFGPKPEHVRQATGYMICSGLRAVRFIYEDKNTQANLEYRVEYDDELASEVIREWHLLNDLNSMRKLADMIPECKRKTGFFYNYCDYNELCSGASWPKTRIRLSD